MAKQDVKVELFYSSQWNDVTGDMYTREPIEPTWGRRDESSEAQPGSAELTFTGAKYNPRNVGGLLHGLIGRNTPIRVHFGTPHVGDSDFDLTDTSSHVAPSLDSPTNDALLLCAWAAPANNTWSLPGGMTAVTNQINTQSIQAASESISASGATGTRTATFGAVEDFMAASVLLHGTSPTVQASEGDSNQTMSLGSSTQADWWVVMFTSFWTDPGIEMNTVPGTPTADNVGWFELADTGALHVDDAQAEYMRMKAWVGRIRVDGSQDITFDWFGTARSTMIVVSGVGEWDPRFAGEVSSWKPRRSVDENDVYVEIEAAGILRRLGQGSSPLRSPLFRDMTSPQVISQAIDYWACEDGSEATQILSAKAGGDPMRIDGDVAPASSEAFVASAPIVVLNDGSISGGVQPHGSDTVVVSCIMDFPSAGLTNGGLIARLSTTGTGPLREFRYVSGGGGRVQVTIFDADGNVDDQDTSAADFLNLDGKRASVLFTITADSPNPGDSSAQIAIREVFDDGTLDSGYDIFTVFTSTVTFGGRVRSVEFGGNLGDAAIGHIAVWPFSIGIGSGGIPTFSSNPRGPLVANTGETAGGRIVRLCGEEGIPISVTGAPSDTAALGPQGIATLLALLREAAKTDAGILGEDLTQLGLRYRTRSSLYNQAAALTVDYSANEVAPPLNPSEDDQNIRNDVTVKRVDGSSHRAQLTTGPLSTDDPPTGVGRYDTDVETNVVGDGFLPNQAGWRLHLGTVEEQRWPQITLDLDAAPTLASAVAALQLGDRVDIVNPPSTLTPNTIATLVQGWSEKIGSHRRKITLNCSPEIPWRVATYEDTQGDLNKYDTGGSQLNEALTTSETAVDVLVTVPPFWTTDAGELPFDVYVGGERMTITAIGAESAGVQTFTVTRSVNGVVKSHPSGADVRLWRTPVYAL